ncbi:hypothetical protein GIW54_07470 [Pseudomonas proteolytica]|uniref:Uncharacterized protein n=1 Tax=Pseudomonas proteolytica TaxID=219574 RepID=A0AAW5A800_9PSED|nr:MULTISPECIES: hypothetical protein [Pseudomonas]MBT9301622.1 hypothetical protein [Pseudomonas sp. TAE6080]MCF5056920.1 hypothetical protein [Pseudomonas proteolytica]MCF5100602.1 hypothetical protein [Pseudomonas proteolytica]NNA67360.1 hypothetical protein [Pseudomonas gessardii]
MDDEDFYDELFKNAQRLHGVPYLSRFNRIEEVVEMERFIREVAAAGLEACLRGLFYDSKADICQIETVGGLTQDDPDAVALFQVARKHVDQFDLLGRIGHGGGFV